MRGWALRLVLSLVPGEEARGVFEKWLFLPFVGWVFFWSGCRSGCRTGRPPPLLLPLRHGAMGAARY